MRAILQKQSLWIISAAVLSALNLSASTVTFAQFQEAGSGGNDFTFANLGTSATFETKDPVTGVSTVPVTFSFLSFTGSNALPADLQGPQAAQMSFYIATTQPVITSGHFFEQNLYSTDSSGLPNYGTITFTRVSPDNELHQTNLLTISFTAISAGLDGIRRGQTATLSADNENNLGNAQFDYVQFSSSYIDFANAGDENLALSFTSASPCFSTYQNVSLTSRGCIATAPTLLTFLHSFTAAGTGTFASDPQPISAFAVPEPSTAALPLFWRSACSDSFSNAYSSASRYFFQVTTDIGKRNRRAPAIS